jgi:hypothetical protein
MSVLADSMMFVEAKDHAADTLTLVRSASMESAIAIASLYPLATSDPIMEDCQDYYPNGCIDPHGACRVYYGLTFTQRSVSSNNLMLSDDVTQDVAVPTLPSRRPLSLAGRQAATLATAAFECLDSM